MKTQNKLAVAVGMILAGAAVAAAETWQYEGTSAFKLQVWKGIRPSDNTFQDEGNFNALTDHQYLTTWAMVVDGEGNIYFTAGDIRNCTAGANANYPGGRNGVTIMKPDGSGGWNQINIDFSDYVDPQNPANNGRNQLIGITKLVVAGDGKVYALANWFPIQDGWDWLPAWLNPDGAALFNYCWPGCTMACRIFRINPDGSVDLIREEFPPAISPIDPIRPQNSEHWLNRINDITVGADGHLYWWYAGITWGTGDSAWKTHMLWRYNVTTQAVEESVVTAGINNGFEDFSKLHCFQAVGTTPGNVPLFVVVRMDVAALGARKWKPNVVGWENNRHYAYNPNVTTQDEFPDQLSPNGHDWVLHTAYDPAFNRFWAAGRGIKGGGKGCIIARWNGDPVNPGLFTDTTHPNLDDPNRPYREGIQAVDVWHANGNDPAVSGVDNGVTGTAAGSGGSYWVNTLVINPGDGSAWMSWGATDTRRWGTYTYAGTYGPVGGIYSVGPMDTGPTGSHGVPQAAHPDPTKAGHASQVLAIAFHGQKVYALTVDMVDLEFNVFSAENEAAILGACCQAGNVCTETLSGTCAMLQGVFQGPHTTCAESDCRFKVCNTPFADADGDGDVDQVDFSIFQMCLTADGSIVSPDYARCDCFDAVQDGEINGADYTKFEACSSGPGIPVNPNCADD